MGVRQANGIICYGNIKSYTRFSVEGKGQGIFSEVFDPLAQFGKKKSYTACQLLKRDFGLEYERKTVKAESINWPKLH